MTCDKLSKELKQMQKQYTEKDYEYAVLDEAIRCADKHQYVLDALDAAEEQLAKYTEWTPVEVLLPKEDGDYLVTIENSKGERSMDVTCYKDFDGIGYCWGIEAYTSFYKVLAWTELPPMWEG